MRVKESTNGIIHLVDKEGFYKCIRAVGKHKNILNKPSSVVTCKNCLRKLK